LGTLVPKNDTIFFLASKDYHSNKKETENYLKYGEMKLKSIHMATVIENCSHVNIWFLSLDKQDRSFDTVNNKLIKQGLYPVARALTTISHIANNRLYSDFKG